MTALRPRAILAGMLVIGFVANLAIRPVAERFYMPDDQTV